MNKKNYLLGILFLFIFLSLNFVSASTWWNSSWIHREKITLVNNNTILYQGSSDMGVYTKEQYPTTNYDGSILFVQSYYVAPSGRNMRAYIPVNLSNYDSNYSLLEYGIYYFYVQATLNYVSTNPIQVYYCNDTMNVSNVTWNNQDTEITNCVFKQNITNWNTHFTVDFTGEIKQELQEDRNFIIKLKFFSENSTTQRYVIIDLGPSYSREKLSYYHANFTDFQVKISLNTTKLYQEGKLNNSCKDIRATWYNDSSNSEVEVSYWIKNCVTNNLSINSTIYVKVPQVRSKIYYNDTIYLYYGNPNVEATSSFNNTIETPLNRKIVFRTTGTNYGSYWDVETDGDGEVYTLDDDDECMHWHYKENLTEANCLGSIDSPRDLAVYDSTYIYFVGQRDYESGYDNDYRGVIQRLNRISLISTYELNNGGGYDNIVENIPRVVVNGTGYPITQELYNGVTYSIRKRNPSSLSTSINSITGDSTFYDNAMGYYQGNLYVTRNSGYCLNISKYNDTFSLNFTQKIFCVALGINHKQMDIKNDKIAILSESSPDEYLTVLYTNGTLITNKSVLDSSSTYYLDDISWIDNDKLIVVGTKSSHTYLRIVYENGTTIREQYNLTGSVTETSSRLRAITLDRNNTDDTDFIVAGEIVDNHSNGWIAKYFLFKNSTYPITYSSESEVAVIVNLISPENNYNTSSTSVTFHCNATSQPETSNLTNLILYTNTSGTWKYEYSIDNGGQNVSFLDLEYTINNINNSVYAWGCIAHDTLEMEAISENRTFIIDNVYPNVTLVSPATNSIINSTNNNFTCNASDNIDLKNISIYTNLTGFWALLNTSNITGTFNESNFTINVNSYSDGVYLWSCAVCDRVNCNNSFVENRTFIINKSINIDKLEGYINKDLNSVKFYNNLTLHTIINSSENVVYANFSLVDPNGIVRINNVNGTKIDNNHWKATQGIILNVTGQWKANVTTKNILNNTAEKTVYFNITDNVGWLTNYSHSLNSTERGTNLTYNLTLWHDSDECFRFTLKPYLNYSNNFTVYLSENDTIVCASSIENPKIIVVKIYVNSTANDGVYTGNITINRTNTSSIYKHDISIAINPPTAQPQLLTMENIVCNHSLDSAYGYWGESVYVNEFKSKSYQVKNIGDYNASECFVQLLTNESDWDYGVSINNFSLNVNETKTFTISARVTSGAGTNKQAYISVTCQKSTVLGYPASTLPENNPIVIFMVSGTSQGQQGGGGGGGGGGREELPPFECLTGNISWKATNDRGGGSYYWYLYPKSSRSGDIVFENLGVTTVTITAECYGASSNESNITSDICDYVTINPSGVILEPTKEQKRISVLVNTSNANYKLGDKVYFSVKLKDNYACQYYFPITIEFSQKAKLFSIENLFGKFVECRYVKIKEKDQCIPVWLIMIILFLILTLIFYLVYRFLFNILSPMAYAVITSIILNIFIYIFII